MLNCYAFSFELFVFGIKMSELPFSFLVFPFYCLVESVISKFSHPNITSTTMNNFFSTSLLYVIFNARVIKISLILRNNKCFTTQTQHIISVSLDMLRRKSNPRPSHLNPHQTTTPNGSSKHYLTLAKFSSWRRSLNAKKENITFCSKENDDYYLWKCACSQINKENSELINLNVRAGQHCMRAYVTEEPHVSTLSISVEFTMGPLV